MRILLRKWANELQNGEKVFAKHIYDKTLVQSIERIGQVQQ
jgi:hypothetical protein